MCSRNFFIDTYYAIEIFIDIYYAIWPGYLKMSKSEVNWHYLGPLDEGMASTL